MKTKIASITLFAGITLLQSQTSYAVHHDVFFAGGQSNAKIQWANGIESGLNGSGSYENVIVVHANTSGAALRYWSGVTASNDPFYPPTLGYPGLDNLYQVHFFNTNGTGVLETEFAQLMTAGDTYTFRGLFWFQGEGDTSSDTFVNAYAGLFDDLIDTLTADIGQASTNPVNFSITVIDADEVALNDPARYARVNNLRTIQQSIGDSASHGIASDSRGLDRIDQWHVNHVTSALSDFGSAAGTAFAAASFSPPSDGSSIIYQDDFETGLIGWQTAYGPLSIVNDAILGNALNTGGSYSGRGVQFTETTLTNTGDYIELKFDYRVNEVPNSGYIRIGLFNDINDTFALPGSATDPYEGSFIALGSPSFSKATRVYGQTTDGIGNTGAPSVNSDFDIDVRASDTNAYTFLMRITRDATGYTTKISHGTQGGALSVVETLAIASPVYTYDTFGIRGGKLENSVPADLPILIDNISVVSSIIPPEPPADDIVYEEDFTDGSVDGWRKNYGSITIVDDSAGIGSGNAIKLVANYAAFATQFTETTLANTGDWIQYSFDYRFEEVPTAGYVRIGMFNDVNDTLAMPGDETDPYEGSFIALRSPAGSSATRIYSQTTSGIGNTGAPSENNNFATDVRAGDTNAYTFVVRLTRGSSGYTSAVSHGPVGGTLTTVNSHTFAGSVYTFDTFAVRDGDLQSASSVDLPILIDNISVTRTPVPPSEDPFDDWAASYGLSGVKTDDYDNDGMNDFLEYALDGNPTNDAIKGKIETGSDASDQFIFIYSERTDDTNLVYTLRDTVNLVVPVYTTNAWDSTASGPSGVENFDFVTNRYGTTGKDTRFFNLNVE